MKVLLTSDAHDIAGGENYLIYLAEGLRNKGHNVSVAPKINSALSGWALENNFQSFEIDYGVRGKELPAIIQLTKKIKNKNFDIVHSNAGFDRTIAAFAGKITGAKNVSTIHSCLSIARNPVHRFRNKFLIDHFTPVGHSTKKILVETDKIPEDKITVVHIGLPVNKISFSPEGRKSIRKIFNIGENTVLFGTLSRLVEFKGHTYLLKAVSMIKDQADFKIMITGEGELKEDLINESKNLGIQEKIIFTGHRNDVADILSAFDVIVQPSTNFGGETFPVSILEALAAGLPVIASNVGDIKFMVDDSNGRLIPPAEPGMLARVMQEFIRNEDLRKNAGRNSREKFLNNFTLDEMVRRIESVYMNLLK